MVGSERPATRREPKAEFEGHILISGEEIRKYLPKGYRPNESVVLSLISLFKSLEDIDGKRPALDAGALTTATGYSLTPIYTNLPKLDKACPLSIKRIVVKNCAGRPRTFWTVKNNGQKRIWKDKSNEEVLEYYKENYDGLKRKELYEVDHGLYLVLQKRGLLENIPRAKRSWEKMSDEDLLGYYRNHYNGQPEHALKKIDPGFHRKLWERNLLDRIPDRPQKKAKTSLSPYGKKLLKEYKEKFARMPWNEFYRHPEGYELHKRLRKYRLLEEAKKICKKLKPLQPEKTIE